MPRQRTPGNIERLKDCFRIRLSIAGERHYFTLPTTVRAEAVEFAKKKFAELTETARRRALAGIEGRMRFSALLEAFEHDALPALAPGAADAYRDSLKTVRPYFVEELGDPLLEAIQPRHIEAYMTWRRSHRLRDHRRKGERSDAEPTTVSSRTVAKDRAVLHRIFAFADRLEYRDGNPVARTEAPAVDAFEPVILNGEQFDALVAACADRPMLRLYVLLLAEAGVRANSEALWVRFEDVDLEHNFLWIASGRDGHRTKSGRGRWVPMTVRLADAMRDHFAAYRLAAYHGERSPWVFHWERDFRGHKAGSRITSLYPAFIRAAARAKLPEALRQHDLRHRRVTKWLAEGRSPALVQEALGHADITTTLGYSHLAREHLAALVDRPTKGDVPSESANVPADVPRSA